MSAKYFPYIKVLHATPEVERLVAGAAKATLSPREFTDLLGSMSEELVEKWIKELVARGHGSPLEHGIYIFEVICSRVCSHQLVRHRHASYSQLSQRYSDKYLRGFIERSVEVLAAKCTESYKDYAEILEKLAESELEFDTLLDIVGEAFIVPPAIVKNKDAEFLKSLIRSTASYYRALAGGILHEDARYLLPQAIKTKIIVSMNARELLEVFLPLRMCARAQWEIRIIAWNLWRQLVEISPPIFKYTGPRCVLAENRVRVEPCELAKILEGKCEFSIPRCPERVPKEQIYHCIAKAAKAL